MNKKFVNLFFISFIAINPIDGLAKTLYVNGVSGNDSTSYANNSEANPWKTIGRASWGSASYVAPNPNQTGINPQAAQPGDIVQIAAGTYWESGDSAGGRFTVTLNPVNSGTASDPITFRGIGLVYIRLNPGVRGAMIGCASNRNYIIWDNFQIDDYYGGSMEDTGPVVFVGSHHCQLLNSDVQGHAGSFFHGYSLYSNNYNAIRYETADFIVIRNNRIHRVWGTGTTTGTGGQNDAGIMSYDSNDGLIENNEIFDVGQAIFIKGNHAGFTQARNIIRYNYVHNASFGGIRVVGAQDTKIYQNIVTNSLLGFQAGFFDATRSRFVNNVAYNNQHGVMTQSTELVDVQFHNNLIVGGTVSGAGCYNVQNPGLQQINFIRNLYYNNLNNAVWNLDGTKNIIPFSTWQAPVANGGYGFDVDGLNGANPLFVNPLNNNFKLQPLSPALTLGRDVLDLNNNGSSSDIIPAGAYITGNEVIGLLSQPASAEPPRTRPRAPQSLSVL